MLVVTAGRLHLENRAGSFPDWSEQNFQPVIPDEITSPTSIPTAVYLIEHTICCAAIRHRMRRQPNVDEPADRRTRIPCPSNNFPILADELRNGTQHAKTASASVLEYVPWVWTTPSALPDETNDMEDLCHIQGFPN